MAGLYVNSPKRPLQMKYAIQVNASPYAGSSAWTALRFTEALLAAGHQVLRIFFYGEGIYQALRHVLPPDDEVNPVGEWTRLAEQYRLDLVVCISAAQRRGLLCDDEAERQGLPPGVSLAEGFRIAGLGQWLEASLQADRCMTFA